MLNINPESACLIIAKAREFHAKEEVVITEVPESMSDDWALQILADHAEDLTYLEIRDAIEDLEPDQQIELVALMWLGRGDYDESEWGDAVQDAGENWTARTADYLIATPLVADYLEEGLNMLGYSCED